MVLPNGRLWQPSHAHRRLLTCHDPLDCGRDYWALGRPWPVDLTWGGLRPRSPGLQSRRLRWRGGLVRGRERWFGGRAAPSLVLHTLLHLRAQIHTITHAHGHAYAPAREPMHALVTNENMQRPWSSVQAHAHDCCALTERAGDRVSFALVRCVASVSSLSYSSQS